MISLERIHAMLDEIAETLPQELYEGLNGGVVLLPEIKYHNQAVGNDLYIMGEYYRDHMMGKYIAIYGGSFQQVYGHATESRMKKELEKTLKHEFTHHIEGLAGDRDLEREDAARLANYRERKGFD